MPSPSGRPLDSADAAVERVLALAGLRRLPLAEEFGRQAVADHPDNHSGPGAWKDVLEVWMAQEADVRASDSTFMLTEALNGQAVCWAMETHGDRTANLERALSLALESERFSDPNRSPVQWAFVQRQVAHIYRLRVAGDRSENLERALAYSQASFDATRPGPRQLPQSWSLHSLGLSYLDRIDGDPRANNLRARLLLTAVNADHRRDGAEDRLGIVEDLVRAHREAPDSRDRHHEIALALCADALTPAFAQLNLRGRVLVHRQAALTYASRPSGNRAHNLGEARRHFDAAMELFSSDADPYLWQIIEAERQEHCP